MPEKPSESRWWQKIPITALVTWTLIAAAGIGNFYVYRADIDKNTAYRENHPQEFSDLKQEVKSVSQRVMTIERDSAKSDGQLREVNESLHRIEVSLSALAQEVKDLSRRIERKGI